MSRYNKEPSVSITGHDDQAWRGWSDATAAIAEATRRRDSSAPVVIVDCYTGVFKEELIERLSEVLSPSTVVRSREAMRPASVIDQLVQRDITDDPVFGKGTHLNIDDFFDADRCAASRQAIREAADREEGPVLVVGVGASHLATGDLLIYADMPRWEHWQRFERDEVSNLGVDNAGLDASLQYKRSFFVDWRVCDKHKRRQMAEWDFVLDTTRLEAPRLVAGSAYREALTQVSEQPFSLVPFFDPGTWGGQWMREVFDLDAGKDDPPPNYAWCFNCVPEENSLLLQFGDVTFETPSINLVFGRPKALLGPAVHSRFGPEFPIRFDFLDTMEGENLSLQVHPLTGYIQEEFGMHYTQDESYYLMDAKEEAVVYLGLKEDCDPERFERDLRRADNGGAPFPAEKYVNTWSVEPHDHLSIPAGTVHCSGEDCLVLEISATPYIFTFKLWDWGRVGLDGEPRPIHLDDGLPNIQWDRDTEWVRENLIENVEQVDSGPNWWEERTGLHELEFIETRRHWFTGPVSHHTHDTVDVLCLVEGDAALVESPTDDFEPFRVNYAEVFVVPAAAGAYTIRPLGDVDQPLATVKAYVRTGTCLEDPVL